MSSDIHSQETDSGELSPAQEVYLQTRAPEPVTVGRNGTKKRITFARLKAALLDKRGNITRVADHFGRERQTIYNYLKRYRADPRYAAEIERVLEEAQEIRLDKAEGSLDDAADDGQGWAVSLILKTKGRKRGYGDELGLTGGVDEVTGERLPITITLPDNGRENQTETPRPAITQGETGGDGARPATGTTDENPIIPG